MSELGKKNLNHQLPNWLGVFPPDSPNPGTVHHYGPNVSQEFSGYKWKPFYAMVENTRGRSSVAKSG